MTRQGRIKREVGVRELHNNLSRYVKHVSDGGEVTVTMRGRPVARLVPAGGDPLAELRRRGAITDPSREWEPLPPIETAPKPTSPVADIVIEQRRG